MVSVGICDDDMGCRKILKEFCERFFDGKNQMIICEYATGEEFVEQGNVGCAEGKKIWPDILLLDIEMEGISGIELKRELAVRGAKTRILFVTSHDELMAEGYGKFVFGFLMKPLIYENFQKKMEEILADLEQAEREVWIVRGKNDREKFFLSQILYMESRKPYTDIFYKDDEKGLIRITYDERGIQYWEERLQCSDFFLLNRKDLVNLAHIVKIDGEKITMDNGRIFTVSRRNRKQFWEAHRQYEDMQER